MDFKSANVWLCGIIFSLASALVMVTYVSGPLSGDFDKHLMFAKTWGIPHELQEHGIEPLYLDAFNKGWDGQFYFYVANDLLARGDIPKHIDADAYRYQRVGIPLLAKAVSAVFGQTWVSPAFYYGTQAGLIFLATVTSAAFFSANGVSPFWILPWCLAAGTQITLLNGLPDGAADGLLIIALISAYRRKFVLYAVFSALACLAREAYVLLPFLFFTVHALAFAAQPSLRMRYHDYLYLAFPGLIFAAWHTFIRFKFTYSPSEQSADVLGFPLWRTTELLVAGFLGQYPGVAPGQDSYRAGLGIFLFLGVIFAAIFVALKIKYARPLSDKDLFKIAVKAFVLVTCALYLSFGDTVMWNFTGYMKAAALLIFMVPFMMVTGQIILVMWPIVALFTIVTVFFGMEALRLRVLGAPIIYNLGMNCGQTSFLDNPDCKEKFVWLGRELPGITGRIMGDARIAEAALDKPNILTFGPYIDLPQAQYRVSISYAGTGHFPGILDIVATSVDGERKIMNKFPLKAQALGDFNVDLTVTDKILTSVEIRVQHVRDTLAVHSISVEKK